MSVLTCSTKDLFPTHAAEHSKQIIMKTLFTAEAISKGGRSGTIQTPDGLLNVTLGKQKRQAEHIEAGYEKKGFSMKTAEARAWATVNKLTGGGKKSGSGRNEK